MRRNSTPKTRRGANLAWRTIDLHLHTPASGDYQEPHVTYLDILRVAESRGLDIIAFTDHNSVAGLRHMRDEIAGLELLERLQRLLPEEAMRLNEYRRLLDRVLVLPGFEFTATFGFHILGIFPPETQVRDLEHLLLSLNVPREQLDRGSAAVGATVDVLTAYRRIVETGGLAIAAHANSTSGVAMRGFGFGGQTKIAFTQDPNLCALEVTDLDQKGRRTTAAFFSGTKPEYPRRMHCITGSDAHRLMRDPQNARNYGVGDRATDVLIEDVSFEALRALFAGSDFARTRPHVPGKSAAEFDPVQQARDEGPNLVQAFHDSMAQRGGRLYGVVADVCAFANTNGGTIYVGVSPEPKQPAIGVPDPEQAMRELRSAITRMITPDLPVTVDLQDSRGKKVIRVIVPRGEDTPYAIEDNKIYVREEAETSLAVRDEIVQLVRRGQAQAAPASAPPPAAAAAEARDAVAEAAFMAPMEHAAETPPTGAAVPPVVTPDEPAVGPPRTGVEIVATEERDGVKYHTMRDLRNGSVVKNVTRTSARKLWHYAITSKESGALRPDGVLWHGPIGLWRKSHKGGAMRYDLVQRVNGEMRVYYGVTEDGVHGAWKRLVEAEERRQALAALPGAEAAPEAALLAEADRPATLAGELLAGEPVAAEPLATIDAGLPAPLDGPWPEPDALEAFEAPPAAALRAEAEFNTFGSVPLAEAAGEVPAEIQPEVAAEAPPARNPRSRRSRQPASPKPKAGATAGKKATQTRATGQSQKTPAPRTRRRGTGAGAAPAVSTPPQAAAASKRPRRPRRPGGNTPEPGGER